MKFLYFGHSRLFYDTDEEKKALVIIRENFPNHRILNPNTQKHQDGCRKIMKEQPGTEMEYFINLTKMCEIGIFLPKSRRMWTPGSATEAKRMMKDGKPVFVINLKKGIVEPIKRKIKNYTFEEHAEYLKEVGNKYV